MRALSVLLLFIACTPAPAPKKEAKPHPYFAIERGVHAVQCTSCHALTNTNFAQFSCTGCHAHGQEVLAPIHASVAGFRYESAACYSCHPTPPGASDPTQDVVVTALVPTWSNTSIVSVTPSEESLPMRMNHSSPQPEEARTSCSNCHVNADLGLFYPGQFHGALNALMLAPPTECAGCHRGSVPEGFVGAVVASRNPPSGEMKHDALSTDCSTCHVAPSLRGAASWKTDARFHQALLVQPTSCLDCHANSRPAVVTLPSGIKFDHAGAVWLGDCSTCHRAGFASWAGGNFHPPGVPTPLSCLPCHEPRRPTTNDRDAGFDYATNAQGITHGAGQDCAGCHRRDGGQPSWANGFFSHGPTTLAATTCVACHSTQRPTTTQSCPDAGPFDHPAAGGDCFGCHQQTNAFTQLSDWACGEQYPGPNLMSSVDRFITVSEVTLKRGGPNNLVIGTSSIDATLFNAMLHTSGAIPTDAGLAPGPLGDASTCWHCHTSTPGTTTVTSYVSGQFHASLAGFRVTPTAAVTTLAQPADRCSDCHSNMRPPGIVQRDAGVLTTLRAMDHDAKFVDGGTLQVDCSVCHGSPGVTWSDGVFHANRAAPEDCTVCHYTLMADGPQVDVISAASPSYKMQHRSTQLTSQRCDGCHAAALANSTGTPAAALWRPGVFHAAVSTQPAACVDCHAGVSNPTQPTQSALNGQWMNHAVALVTARDCAFCHASDIGNGWSTSTRLHRAGISPTTCQSCHANNAPAGLVDSATVTSASESTGHAGANDQLSHADLNVSSRDCNACHTQVGTSWGQASFHAQFTGGVALVMNGTTGRCSNCHLNVKPEATFTAQNHSGFSGTSTDCSACHLWPGTGTAAAPNWHRPGAAAAPPTISVGGFVIAQPPAPNATTTQAGVNGLAHPSVSGGCTSCHAQASGGRGARGYDHALAPATGCSSCHEAGSDLVATSWTPNAAGAVQLAAQCGLGGGTVADRGGDTRPVGLTSLACSSAASSLTTCGGQNCVLNHFYPSDCGECHAKPAAVPATTQTGASYVGNWRFQHYFGAPAQQATCCHCHAGPSCRG